ncbi:hypothetical protein E2C01_014292 [Portunus trituberculatus]|uniref:Uncharacterized protein n=1 Tax=Portunus trituberculatus TaxID=210409 RepID=A0A5B7DJP8_PORTR|nr:hypothetical protein [Portunus trituberculatus]
MIYRLNLCGTVCHDYYESFDVTYMVGSLETCA